MAGMIAGVLGWSDEQIDRELSLYSKLISSQRVSALRPLDSSSDGLRSVS